MVGFGDLDAGGIARKERDVVRKALACSTAVLALSLPVVAQAQIAPSVPTREEIQRPTLPPSAPPGEQVVSADDSIERAPCPLANPEFSNVRVTVRDVIAEVERTKPVRSHFTFTQGLQATNGIGVGGGARVALYRRLYLQAAES